MEMGVATLKASRPIAIDLSFSGFGAVRYQCTTLSVQIAARFPQILFVPDEVWLGLVRPPGFEVPSRCLDGFPGRWVGSPLDAARSYVLDQARLRPLTQGV